MSEPAQMPEEMKKMISAAFGAMAEFMQVLEDNAAKETDAD